MPSMALIVKIVRVVLEYGMLFWLLWFVLHLSRRMFTNVRREIKQQKPPVVTHHEAVLTVEKAGEKELIGRRFAFNDQISIGRGSDNDIVIPERYVSHHHTVIFRRGSQYVIEDLGSMNHTYLNEQILKGSAYLKQGDVIRVGFVTLKFER